MEDNEGRASRRDRRRVSIARGLIEATREQGYRWWMEWRNREEQLQRRKEREGQDSPAVRGRVTGNRSGEPSSAARTYMGCGFTTEQDKLKECGGSARAQAHREPRPQAGNPQGEGQVRVGQGVVGCAGRRTPGSRSGDDIR
jgi:hypothetical protein